LAVTGCAHGGFNYSDPAMPRYARAYAAPDSTPAVIPDTLRVVTFNVQFSVHSDLAARMLLRNDSLRHADVVMLQEMDERGVRLIADSLGMGYVYYPASVHPLTGRDFGNAILSRWPLQDDRKIILPHLARFNSTQRIAVAATMVVGEHRIRVYSLHLATLLANGPTARRDQLRTVLADADSFPCTLIAGDFNSETVPALGLAHNLAWPTHGMMRTNALWTFDHVLLRGLNIAGANGFGTVLDRQGASDHRPVWARIVFAPTAVAATQ